MTELEHQKIVDELKGKYVGKKIKFKGEKDFVEIWDVYVDYRETHQYMNRLLDEYGNIYFLHEIEEILDD